MKKKRAILLIIILALCLIFVLPIGMDFLDIPVSKDTTETVVTIDEGTSSFRIGSVLKENGLIRSKTAFFVKVKLSKYSGKLRSGTYTLSKNMSIVEMCEILSKPKPVRQTITVTFPEGYSAQQMAHLLEKKGLVSSDAFLKALDDNYEYEFIDKIKEGDYNYKLQGFLFPDTYEFYTDSSAHEIIDRMLSRFNEIYLGISPGYEDVFDIVIKASMIEKEAKLKSERATVAGVIENRIKRNMAFQIDACVLYAATGGMYNREESTFIAKNIKELDSPYNTYMYAGLPAGPICNPGIESLKAALNPQIHNYLYYHTDTRKNDGSHIFTETFNAHINSMN